ncbi:MAG: amidohydrolase [Senegalia sp. (in: firmicutes)]|uniref:amidohydrolase n=1 Tax=Senegalia sp. (in: firmicutes) TaxID=1924098 RepID=UPI003F97EBD6
MDTILIKGKIYIEKDIFKEALYIKDGIIKEIGSNEAILKNDCNNIIDLENKTVIPGFNDSHMHLLGIGEALSICNLNNAKSINDVIKLGKAFLNENMDYLYGRGWNQDYFTSGENRLLNRFDLDKISTDIPIVFNRVCGHVSVSNTKALELLNIDSNTRVDGGTIEVDKSGIPNGIFNENAIYLIQSIIPEKSKEQIESEFLKASNYVISVGITSVQSCDISDTTRNRFDVLHDIYNNTKTKLRYTHQYNFQNINQFKNYIDTEFKSNDYDERFLSKGMLKLFKDGSLGARTALLLDKYKDDDSTKGVAALSDGQLQDLCNLASKNDIKVVTHAIGDSAIENVINTYENTMTNNENKLRHGIVHCQITNEEQLKRISDLSISVMAQPIFLDYDIDIVEKRVGKELTRTSYAFNTLNKTNAQLSLSTDAPVEDANPFPNIYCAVNRMKLDGRSSDNFIPAERMTIEDAIDAYTVGSAINEFKEDFKGRLKPGYVADLIVLDSDIFTINSMNIKDIKVEKTMIDGEFVYIKKQTLN